MVERRRATVIAKRLIRDCGCISPPSAADWARWCHLRFGEKRHLHWSAPVFLEPFGDDLGPFLAEKLLGPIKHGYEAHDSLLRLDAAPFPGIEVDAEGLRETAGHVEGE